jgi:hypothetical protein
MRPKTSIEYVCGPIPPLPLRPQDLQGWSVAAGFVGCVRASIPLTAVSAQGSSLEVEELMITVRPEPEVKPQQHSPEQSSSPTSLDQAEGFLSLEDIGLGQVTVMEGIKRIAGGIEKLLQQLTVVARNTTIRIELPANEACAQDAVILVRAGVISYHDATPQGDTPLSPRENVNTPIELVKVFDLQGLAVEMYEAGDADVAGSPGADVAQSRCMLLGSPPGEDSEGSEADVDGWEEQQQRGERRRGPAAGGWCCLPAACCLLPAACCLLPAACCLLPAACCLLPAAVWR